MTRMMRVLWIAGALALAAACEEKPQAGALDAEEAQPPRDPNADPTDGKFTLADALAGLEGAGELRAKIETKEGVMVAKLYEHDAPNTVANFVGLARGVR